MRAAASESSNSSAPAGPSAEGNVNEPLQPCAFVDGAQRAAYTAGLLGVDYDVGVSELR